MDRHAEFGYAQTRLQARHAARPDETEWRRLESIGDLAAFLQDARLGGLRPWVLTLSAETDTHAIEYALRQQLRNYIDEVARWQPARWRAAVRWLRTLPDLPVLQHLLSSQPLPGWLRHDPQFAAVQRADGTVRWEVLRAAGYAPLLTAWRQGVPLTQAWSAQWRSLWPDAALRVSAALETLVSLLADHLQILTATDAPRGDTLRAALAVRLSRLFRRHTQQPAAAFSHLGLIALDLQRLRGAVLRRRLFAAPTGVST